MSEPSTSPLPSHSGLVPEAPRAASSPHPPAPPAPRRPLRTALWWLVLLLVVGGGIWRVVQTRRQAAEKPAVGSGRGGSPQGPVPVVAGPVQTREVRIFLDGLGTIQAMNTVTVRARVDGQIDQIAFREGQEVKEGDLLAQIDPAPFRTALDQALAKQRQDEVQLANSRRDLERNRELIRKNVIATQQFDYQEAQVAQFEALVKNDQAAVANAQVQLGYATITSPLNGRTGLRLVDQGNLVRATDATGIVVITQLRPISLIFTLPEQRLTEIHTQQEKEGPLLVQALARDNRTVLAEGKLTVIDNQIDTTTGTIRLKAEFPNEDLSLWPGQFCNARLLARTRSGGVVVPASVVQRGPENAFAYVIKPDQTVEVRTIKVGQIEQGEALIEEGLKPGEQVVVDGQYKLQPGAKIQIQPFASGPPARPTPP